QLSDLLIRLKDTSNAFQEGILGFENTSEVQRQLGIETDLATGTLRDQADAFADVGGATDDAREALDRYVNATRAATDPFFAVIDASNRAFDAQRDVEQSLRDLADAQDQYNQAVASGDT